MKRRDRKRKWYIKGKGVASPLPKLYHHRIRCKEKMSKEDKAVKKEQAQEILENKNDLKNDVAKNNCVKNDGLKNFDDVAKLKKMI